MTAPISQYQIELLARARARIAKSQVRYGEKIAYPADMNLMLDLVAQIESLTSALEYDAAPPASEGWKLVPIEPTREMVAAAFEAKDHVANALSRAAEGGFSSGVMCVYGAMINAAPPRAMPLQERVTPPGADGPDPNMPAEGWSKP